jgi:ribosomal protein S18 acetylase RimI-like enzyme
MASAHGSRASSAADSLAVIVRDTNACIPISKRISESDIIVLLTPVTTPLASTPSGSCDPFEILGRSLALRHPLIRHVPYTRQNGITGTHVAFIRRAKIVIFVISGDPNPNEPAQTAYADMARVISEQRVYVVVACSASVSRDLLENGSFAAVIRSSGYSNPELEAVASILFGGQDPTPQKSPPPPTPPRQNWPVAVWHPIKDMQPMYDLWCKALPKKFHVNRFIFGNLLRRDGWAKHWVVRDPASGNLIGYSATYTTYADSDTENLVGSLAMVIVHPDYRRRGIGTLLHDRALSQLKRTRGVHRLQLGSTYPRLLLGPPMGLESTQWFRNRGWDLDFWAPGQGFPVSDWLLSFENMPQAGVSPLAGLEFRTCEFDEFPKVMGLVKGVTVRHPFMMGWYDQYAKLSGTPHITDIVIGLVDDKVVATAITYECNSGSPVGQDMPWPGTIGGAVGGVTCVCIPDDDQSNITHSKDSLMIRLLDACVRQLRTQSCTAMFIDSVRGGKEGFQSLGE